MSNEQTLSTSVLDQFRLDGRTAIITGVGEGIGEHVARAFAEVGANVVLCARSPARVESIVRSIEADGGSALAITADVSRAEDIDRLTQQAQDRFGAVTILFNNAAGGLGEFVEPDPNGEHPRGFEAQDQMWDDGLAVNLLAPVRLTRALTDGMRAAGRGSIINVLSTVALVPVPLTGTWAYAATKAGTHLITRYMARELGTEIRANAICPGTIDARGEVRPAFASLVASIPLGRVGLAREVVGAALFLASDASSYVTGEVICVDGGRVNTASM